MKTKHILTAMVLPAMFAACTAEEIVENNNIAANVNRTQVESVTFAINGEADSRLAWDEETGKFAWEDTDKFLLFPADNGGEPAVGTVAAPKYPGQRFTVGTTLVTGYEYAKGEDGTYTTEAAVMGEGLYWGYAPSFNKTGRGLIGYEISTSQDAEYYKSEAAHAFITPMYEVSDLNYNNKLPLEMINFYSTVVIPLTNSTKEDMTLNQIVLELQGDDYFVTKGLINIAAMGDYIMAYDGKKWDDFKNLDNVTINDRKAGKLLDDMRKTYLVKEYAKAEDGEKSQVIMLNLGGDVLEAGETKEYRMLVPAANGKVSFNIIVLAKEGYKEITAASQSNYMYNTNIYHNGEKAAFGRKDGVAKAYSLKNLVDAESNRFYVASKDELLDKIYEVNGTFTAVKVGTWNIDSEVAQAIEESDSYVIFEGNYTIGEEAASRAENEGIVLTKVAFKGEATVLEGNKVTFDESTIDINELQAGSKLTIEEGAEVIIKDGIFAGEIVNAGTLTVNETVKTSYTYTEGSATKTAEYINKITSTGAVTLKGYDHNVTLNGGSLTYTAANIDATAGVDEMNVSKLTLAAALANDITINVGEDVVLALKEITKNNVVKYVDGAVSKTLTIVNNGEIVVTSYVNMWNVTNNGKISGQTGHLILNGDDSKNTNEINVGFFDVMKNAVLTNEGDVEATSSGNDGLIIAKSGSYTEITRNDDINSNGQAITSNGNKGRIDNTEGGNLALGTGVKANQIIFHKFTSDFNLDDMANLKVGLHQLNTMVIDGAKLTWEFDKKESVANCSDILRAELVNGAEFFVPASEASTPVAIDTYFTEIYVKNNATISGWSAEKSIANAHFACSIELAKAASLTFERVSFNALDNVTFIAPTLTTAEVTGAANQKANCAKVVVKDDAEIAITGTVTVNNADATITGCSVATAKDYSDVAVKKSLHITGFKLN